MGDAKVATMRIDVPVGQLEAERTPDGLVLKLPLTIDWHKKTLRADVRLLGLRAELHSTIADAQFLLATATENRMIGTKLALKLHCSFAALALYEARRAGGDVSLLLRWYGPLVEVVTDLRNLVNASGDIGFVLPNEVWAKTLRDREAAENVVVEAPLPANPGAPFGSVFKALASARRDFTSATPNAWKNTLLHTRTALEKWRDLEAPKFGPGWSAPTLQDARKWTKRERIDGIRHALHQLAHLGAHDDADEFTRDDAALALACLAGLLAERSRR